MRAISIGIFAYGNKIDQSFTCNKNMRIGRRRVIVSQAYDTHNKSMVQRSEPVQLSAARRKAIEDVICYV